MQAMSGGSRSTTPSTLASQTSACLRSRNGEAGAQAVAEEEALDVPRDVHHTEAPEENNGHDQKEKTKLIPGLKVAKSYLMKIPS